MTLEATWFVSLSCDCPACHESVDLLDDPDFWEVHRDLEIAEHGTERSNALDVVCPECGNKFQVRCVW